MEKNKFEGKSIIMAAPNHFGLPQRFKENLEFLGFKVLLLQSDERVSVPLKDKLIHVYKKLVHKDKSHKRLVKNKLCKQKQLSQLSTIENADYALFIRPDLFDYEVVNAAREKSGKIVAYQWDGLERYPLVKSYITLFDKFYVFDKNDLENNPNLYHTDNFYFDDVASLEQVEKGTVFFLGTYMKYRLALLEKVSSVLMEHNLTPNFFLYSKRKRSALRWVKILYEGLSFKQSIQLVQRSEYLLDLQTQAHSGLSFRVFESVGYNKKLITNNPLVQSYDFYNPNNVFIWGNDHFENLELFVNTSYQPLEAAIKEKYCFSNWINNMLQ